MRNEAAEIGPDCGKLLCELMLVYLTKDFEFFLLCNVQPSVEPSEAQGANVDKVQGWAPEMPSTVPCPRSAFKQLLK